MRSLTACSQNPHDLETAAFTKFLACVVSLGLSSFAFFTSFLLKHFKGSINVMIHGIILSDFCYSLFAILLYKLNIHTQELCNVIASVETYARISSFTWSACFAHALVSAFDIQDPGTFKIRVRWYCFLSLFIPLFFAVYLNIIEYYQPYILPSGVSVCSHNFAGDSFDLQMFTLYSLPLTLVFLYTAGCFFLAIAKMRGGGSRELLTLLIYPIITILCWSPYLPYQVMSERCLDVPEWLRNIAAIFSGLPGSFHSLLYVFSYADETQ